MLQVDPETRASVDHDLKRSFAAWEGLIEVEPEIDSWDLIQQIVYIEERPLEEERLKRLAEHARAGGLTQEQCLRYQALPRLVEERKPVIERLRRS